MPTKANKLTAKQRRFVEEYLVDLNATQAAIRAGYAESAARQQGAENLSKPVIRAAIDKALAERSGRVEIDATRVLQEYALLAFSDIGAILDFSGTDPKLKPASQIPEAARRAISSIKVRRHVEGKGDDAQTVEVTEFKLWSKEVALRDLAKHVGLLKDRIEHTGKDGAPLVVGIEFVQPEKCADAT